MGWTYLTRFGEILLGPLRIKWVLINQNYIVLVWNYWSLMRRLWVHLGLWFIKVWKLIIMTSYKRYDKKNNFLDEKWCYFNTHIPLPHKHSISTCGLLWPLPTPQLILIFFINQLNVVSSKQYICRNHKDCHFKFYIIDSEMQESIEIEVTYYRCSIRKQDHIRPTYLPLRGSLNLELKLRFITCNTIAKGGG